MNRYHRFCKLMIFFALGSFSSCKQQPGADADTLARIGTRVIAKEDFVKRYQDFRRRTGGGVPDHGEARRQVLQNYVEEELLITAAGQRGYAEDAAGRHEHERIAVQELLNAYNREMIASAVRVREDELKELYVRLHTKVKARHLYAPTRSKADSLYAALQHGASFETLAAATFKDPVLRNSGGALGYFTVDEMDPSFEDAAFRLKIGEISRPVRTVDGYSIIRVDDRVTQPLLTETDYAKHRDNLQSYWKMRKTQVATQAFVDSMRQALQVSFNEPVVAALFAHLRHETRPEVFVETQGGAAADSLDNQTLVASKLGVWDVAHFRAQARFTSTKQQDWIRTPEHVRDFIAGLVVRAFILDQARSAGLDQQPGYREQVAEKFDTYLLERMENALHDEMRIPEDTLRAYFNANSQRFAVPPQVQLREIVLSDKKLAGQLARQLQGGASFSDLARKYSERRRSAAHGGDLGFLTPQDLGRWSDMAFALHPGERKGPVQMDSMFVLLECVAKKPSQPRDFDAARAGVAEAVHQMKWPEARQAFVNQMRQSVPVAMFTDRLNTVRLN